MYECTMRKNMYKVSISRGTPLSKRTECSWYLLGVRKVLLVNLVPRAFNKGKSPGNEVGFW